MVITQRNIEVDSEIWSKLKADAIGRNKNVREFAGEILTDYVKSSYKKEEGSGLKAIILAAGYDIRLMPLTSDKPKCMLEINGKTILERQLELFRACGIDDIVIVKGYKKQAIKYPRIRYYYNKNYKNNKTLGSLFCAESEMDGGFIVTCSDILFKKSVLKRLVESKADISLVIDTDWHSQYENRYQHPIEEAVKVVVKDNRIIKISKSINPNEAYGEFIGMTKFSKFGSEILKENYHRIEREIGDLPFQTSSSLEAAYLPDMIQELIDRGHPVHNIDIEGGWAEVDTIEDYEKVKSDKKWLDQRR